MGWMLFRLVFSLALVAGLLWWASRYAKKRGLGAGGGAVQVLARQPLSRTSSVSVVKVADQVLILGSTEQQVTLLGETTEEAVQASLVVPETAEARTGLAVGTGPVAGSVLDPATWKAAVRGVREKTVRRE